MCVPQIGAQAASVQLQVGMRHKELKEMRCLAESHPGSHPAVSTGLDIAAGTPVHDRQHDQVVAQSGGTCFVDIVTYNNSAHTERRSTLQLMGLRTVAQLSVKNRMVGARSMMCSGNQASAHSAADPILRSAATSTTHVISSCIHVHPAGIHLHSQDDCERRNTCLHQQAGQQLSANLVSSG